MDKLDLRKRRLVRVRESSLQNYTEPWNTKMTKNDLRGNSRLPLSNIGKFVDNMQTSTKDIIMLVALEYISDSPVKAYFNSDNRNMHDSSSLAAFWSSDYPSRQMKRKNFFRRISIAEEPRKTDGEKIDEVLFFIIQLFEILIRLKCFPTSSKLSSILTM